REGQARQDRRTSRRHRRRPVQNRSQWRTVAWSAAMTAALETMGLGKRFRGLLAAGNLSVFLRKGARAAVIGPEGAGQNTFVNLLTGVLSPTEGRVQLGGEDVTSLRVDLRVKRGLARTFQINQLFLEMTPLEALALAVSERRGGGRDGWSRIGRAQGLTAEVAEIAERFRLADVLDTPTASLAYGKQRLL